MTQASLAALAEQVTTRPTSHAGDPLRPACEALHCGHRGSARFGSSSSGGDWVRLTSGAKLSGSEPLAAVFPADDRVDVVAFNDRGRLVAAHAAVNVLAQAFTEDPVELDRSSFSGSAGPVMVSSGPGLLDLVAVDTGGQLRWTSLSPASNGDWDVVRPIGGTTTLARTVRPALANRGTNLDVIAVGVNRLLYTATKPDPQTLGWGDLRQIGGSLLLATEYEGADAVALVSRDPLHLDAFAIDAEGHLNWTWWQASPLVDWFDLELIGGTAFTLSPLGGVKAVSRTPNSIDVFAVDVDGKLLWTQWVAGQDWTALTRIF